MEGSNTITGQVQLLQDAKEAIGKLSVVKSRKEQYDSEDRKLRKKLAADEKQLASDISSMIKKRRESVAVTFDKEISSSQDKLKKVKNEREKALNTGINDRIKQETMGLREENKGLKKTLKKVFSETKTPAICRSFLFYSLYDPGCFSEWLSGIIVALFVFLGIPALLVLCLQIVKPVFIILVFAAFLVVFSGIYVLGGVLLRKPHKAVMNQGEEIKKQIRKNNKKIKKITRSVKKDDDEERYGLQSFDYDIAKWESQIEETNKKKQEALATFDNVTSKVITDEITESGRPKIEETREAIARNKEKLDEAEKNYSEQSLRIAQNYEAKLGKEFMTKERIDALISIIQDGNATNVTEAIVFFKNNKMNA